MKMRRCWHCNRRRPTRRMWWTDGEMPVCKDVEGCQRGYEARRLRRCRRFLGDSNYKVRARWNAWLDEYARTAEALR